MSLVDKYLGEGSANYRLIFKDANGNNINVVELKASSSADAFDKAKMQNIKGAKKVDMVVKKRSIGVYDLSKKRLSESKTPLLDKYKKSKKKGKGNMECMECGKKFKTSKTFDVKCPKCGGYDIEVA